MNEFANALICRSAASFCLRSTIIEMTSSGNGILCTPILSTVPRPAPYTGNGSSRGSWRESAFRISLSAPRVRRGIAIPNPMRSMASRLARRDGKIRALPCCTLSKRMEILYPAAPDTLASLAPRYGLGIIANQAEGLKERLSAWGISNYFSAAISSSDCGYGKPDPRIFRFALLSANCPAARRNDRRQAG